MEKKLTIRVNIMALGQLSEFFSQGPNFWGQEKALSLLGSDLSLDWVANLASILTPTARTGKHCQPGWAGGVSHRCTRPRFPRSQLSFGIKHLLASESPNTWPGPGAALRRKRQKRHSLGRRVSEQNSCNLGTHSFLPTFTRKEVWSVSVGPTSS